MATPEEDIASILKAEGLDIEAWLPVFKQRRITSRAALQHVIGDVKFCAELEKHTQFDWEKRALRKILNIGDKEPKRTFISMIAEKFKLSKKKDCSAQENSHDVVTVLDSEGVKKTFHDEEIGQDKVKQLIPSDSNFVPVEEPTDKPNVQYNQLNGVPHPKKLPISLATVSCGRVLRGVLLTKDIEDHLSDRSFLLQTPKDVSLRPTYQSVDIVKQFSLKSQEDKYKKSVDILGHQVAVPGKYPVYGKTIVGGKRSQAQQTDRGLSVEMYSSVVKHSTVQLATYYFSNTDLKFSEDALHELKKLKSLITSKGDGIQKECENFLKRFGSHVSRGPIHFGGDCWWTCSSKGFRCREREAVKKLQCQVISAVGGIGFSREINIDSIKQDFDRKCSGNTLASTHLEVKLNGGPSEASDFKSWKDNLAKPESTMIITDPGNRYISVWDIIAINYAKELCEIKDVLREAWMKMTGISREQVQLPLVRSDTVLQHISEWNKSVDKTSQTNLHNLEYLIEVKSDLIFSTGNPDAWMEKYLTLLPLQEFLLTVVSLEQGKGTPSERIRFLLQQLVDPLDLQQLTPKTFHNKVRLSVWLYEEDPARLLSESKDIRVLDEYLQKIIEEMEFAKVGNDLLIGNSTEHGEINRITIDSKGKVAKAILSFQLQYKDSLEDILITTLIHPFLRGNSRDPIELQPITLDDLKYLHKQFKEHWKNFEACKDEGNPLKLQAYLFYLAVSIYNVQDEVKHKEVQLKRCLVYIKDSLSLLCQLNPPIAQLLGEYLTSACQLAQFREGMKTIMRTGQPLAPSCTAEDHSLQQVLLTEVHHELSLPEGNVSFIKNQKVHHLFQELDLFDFYPKKLGMEDALRIRPDLLRISLNKLSISHSSQLSKLIMHKIMAYDHLCRSDLMHAHKNRAMKIHPVDSLLAILICADDFLNQDLISRLAKCQLAIPFILPDPFTEQLVLPLWAMRSIVKEWKYLEKGGSVVERGCPILTYKTPVVSFIRIGKRQKRGASKSKILNEVISESHYDHFFDRDCAGGHFELLMGNGLIDTCWYLPAAKPDDALPVAVTFLNLHGDARQYPQQCKLLGAISSMCFILLTEEESTFDQQCITLLNPFASTLGGIVLLNDADEPPEKLHKALTTSEIIDLPSMNAHDTKMLIRKMIIERLPLNSTHQFKSLEQCADVALSLHLDKLYVDEGSESFRQGKQQADKLIKLASSGESGYLGAKQDLLPLQGQDMWQAWAKKDKEVHRQVQRGKCTVNEYTDKIETEKKVIREQQLQHVSQLTPVMESFVVSILSLGGISNTTSRNFYLQCLKIGLNDLSRTSISELQTKYVATRQALHKAQAKVNSTESDDKKELSDDDAKELDRHKKELSKLHTELINASFGLEHLLRELGQLYETAAAQQSQHSSDPPVMEQISRLPEAAAELLIDGYPLEVMDGDAAHVPIRWIKAVLNEVVRILDDPKVYVMSVLGLQSTGKSTMLNTAFGLHFNVSAGRCTRGAFMQLLPVSEEMRQVTGCAYILVVDTEGLRAPELDSQQTQKHDNELATFVIGLANVTLINIYGEVPGDMDDILQTSVHAFLRMNKVKYNPSCQFVHQNAGANVNSEMGRANFTQKLNNMTLDAAKAESCAGQYKTFSDVIQFDDLRDVHHFPGLWKGDPPMAPVNQGYSERAQNLKCHIVSLLEQGAKIDVLSLFETKIGDLWDALLTEKFVFSFKNTLEITAYNSLEAHYNTCDWNFQKCMLEWEKRAENDINAAKSEDIADVMSQKKKDAQVYVQKMYEELKQEMDNFFEASKQSDTLSQWKAKFELKLEGLSEELKLHAQDHCERVGTGRQANSKFEEEKKEYEALMTKMVEEIIQQTKREQELLNDNLEGGKLDQQQVQKILKDGLFELAKMEQYKKQKVISRSQLDQLKAVYRSQHGSSKKTLTEDQLRKILEGQPRILSLHEIRTILKQGELTPTQLRQNFDKKWSKLVTRLPPVHDSGIKVEEAVEEMLIKFVGKEEGQLIKRLQREKNLSLRNSGSHEPFEVMEDTHYIKIRGTYMGEIVDVMLNIGRKFVRITEPRKREAQTITNEVFELAMKYLDDKVSERTNFNKAYTSELLYKLEERITKRSAEFSSHFAFTPHYRIDVFLKVCGHAVGKFEEMAEAFRERNNPRVYLERKLKEPLFTKFKNQYYRTAKEEAIACILCAHLAEPVKTQVENSLGTQVVERMKKSVNGSCFNNKAALKARVLIDLGDDLMAKGGQQRDEKPNARKPTIPDEHFQDYFSYIVNKKESLKHWLCKYTIQYCDKTTGKKGETQLQAIAKEGVSQLISFLKNKVDKIKMVDANEWLKQFCEDEDLISELGVKVDTSAVEVEGMQELNLNTFAEQVRRGLSELEVKVQSQFNDITCKLSMNTWRDKPVDILMKLCGCTEQCPFCNEQCDLGLHDQGIKHIVAQHRPQCLGGYRFISTNVMALDLCPADVASTQTFQNHKTNQERVPFSEYDRIYPTWSIPPDATAINSFYWKWFIGNFHGEIAAFFKANDAEIPAGWKQMKWESVKKDLKKLYKL